MTYSPAPFVLPAPRLPGGLVWTEITWHPTTGEPHAVLAAYAAPVGDHIILIPGVVPIVVSDLALPTLPEGHVSRITALVNRQLREHPRAELVCPAGRAELELHPRRQT